MPQGGWVPLEWFELIVGGLFGALAFLWLGVTWRVYMNNERRLVALETYADPRNEDIRNRLLIAQFREMLAQLELRQAKDLDNKRSSIEATITQQVSEVVSVMKKNGGAK